MSVWETAEAVPELHDLLAQRYAVDLSSEAAEWMRRRLKREREAEAQREQASLAAARSDEAIRSLLDRMEAGDTKLWWLLDHEMMRDATGHRSEFEFQTDLTITPGWASLTEDGRRRVLATANAYLSESPLSDTSWLGTNTSHRPANAGVRALRLLRDEAPESFANVPDATWAAWTPAIIGFFDNAPDGKKIQAELVGEAWRRAPDALLEVIRKIALNPESRGLDPQFLDVFRGVMHPRVVALLEELRGVPGLRGRYADAAILSFLVEMDVEAARREVMGALESAGDGPEWGGGGSLTRAATKLLLAGSTMAWSLLLQVRERNEAVARAVWGELAGQVAFEPLTILQFLDAWSLGQGYVDLSELLPERPSQNGGVRVLGAADNAERLRAMIAGRLAAMGTNASLQQLERIAVTVPAERETLRWSINEARRNLRVRMTVRPDPSDILFTIGAMGRSADEPEQAPEPVAAVEAGPDLDQIEVNVRAPEKEAQGPLPYDRRYELLLVATEWSSAHGGISTLNRELCQALATLGHRVTCLVPEADSPEVEEARTAGVTLVRCPTSEGIDKSFGFLLCGERELGERPSIVIGHDHITGHFGRALATRFGASYVHFLHTIPQEIEALKSERRDKRRHPLSGDEKLKAQVKLATASDLVVAIGPRIHRMFCHEATGTPRIVALIPGLSEALLGVQPNHGAAFINQCLMIGRMEDAGLKGLQLACDSMKLVVEGRSWPSGQTPKLSVRGFSSADADAELEVIDDYKNRYSSFMFLRGFSTDAGELRVELERTGLFLMPSVVEGFGLTGYEAIAAGIPVIVSRESGLAEFLFAAVTDGTLTEALIADCVAQVASTSEINTTDWRTKVEVALTDREGALRRAGQIRDALKAKYRWETAARSLSAEFDMLRTSGAPLVDASSSGSG